MALMCGRPLLLRLFLNKNKNFKVLLSPSYQCFLPVVNYSQNELDPSRTKLNKAMQAYLEDAKKYDDFLKEQLEEYELGKKFLAGMMGQKEKQMSQLEINNAVEYLFPSCLFNKHARPKFKKPQQVFQKKKSVAFDSTGRPLHFLFYTSKPNYSELLHKAAQKLEELQLYQQKLQKAGVVKPESTLSLTGDVWLNINELERKLLEKIQPLEYEKFIELFTRLAEHPYSYMAKDFIKLYRKKIDSEKKKEAPVAVANKDGTMQVTLRSSRKTARAAVVLKYPGTGKIQINRTGLDYFLSNFAREQRSPSFLASELLHYFKNPLRAIQSISYLKKEHTVSGLLIKFAFSKNQ